MIDWNVDGEVGGEESRSRSSLDCAQQHRGGQNGSQKSMCNRGEHLVKLEGELKRQR